MRVIFVRFFQEQLDHLIQVVKDLRVCGPLCALFINLRHIVLVQTFVMLINIKFRYCSPMVFKVLKA